MFDTLINWVTSENVVSKFFVNFHGDSSFSSLGGSGEESESWRPKDILLDVGVLQSQNQTFFPLLDFVQSGLRNALLTLMVFFRRYNSLLTPSLGVNGCYYFTFLTESLGILLDVTDNPTTSSSRPFDISRSIYRSILDCLHWCIWILSPRCSWAGKLLLGREFIEEMAFSNVFLILRGDSIDRVCVC